MGGTIIIKKIYIINGDLKKKMKFNQAKLTTLTALLAIFINTNTTAGFFDDLSDGLGNLVKSVAEDVRKSSSDSNDLYDEDDFEEADELNWGGNYNFEQKKTTPTVESQGQANYDNEIDKFADLRQKYPGRRVVDDSDLKSEGIFSGFTGLFASKSKRINNDWNNKKSITFYYKDEPNAYNGVSVDYHSNGKRKVVWRFKNGMIDGKKQTKWYEDGVTKISETDFENGMGNGTHLEFYKNGSLAKSVSYINTMYDGLLTQYFENGNKMIERMYDEGSTNGAQREWHENGALSYEGFKISNIKYGPIVFYNKSGNITSCEVYTDNAVRVGLFSEEHPNLSSISQSDCKTLYSGSIALQKNNLESKYYSMPTDKLKRAKDFRNASIQQVSAKKPTYNIIEGIYQPNDGKFHDFDSVVSNQMPILNRFINPVDELLSADTKMIKKANDGLFYHKEISPDKPFSGTWYKITSEDSKLGIYDLSGYKENKGFNRFEVITYTSLKGKILEVVAKTKKYYGRALVAKIKDGKYHGKYIEYRLGVVSKVVNFKEGVMDGDYYRYSHTPIRVIGDNTTINVGQFANVNFFDVLELKGKGEIRAKNYKDVRLLSKETYKNGKKSGAATYYWPGLGKVSRSGKYVDGLKDGSWTGQDYLELKIDYVKTDIYKNGKKVIPYSEVDSKNTKTKSDIVYEQGSSIPFTGRVVDGNVFTSYSNGLKDGKQWVLNDDGSPDKSTTFVKNKRQGEYKEWDRYGFIVKEFNFENDKKVNNETQYYSLLELVGLGHVSVNTKSASKEARENAISSYEVAVYRTGPKKWRNLAGISKAVLVSDIIYEPSVRSELDIGYSVSLPIKKKKNLDSRGNGVEEIYAANGHLIKTTQIKKSEIDGLVEEFHPWRRNQSGENNLLMSRSIYKDGSLLSKTVVNKNARLNDYRYELKDHSIIDKSDYFIDMAFVTGYRHAATCFDCYETHAEPLYKEGYEYRRSVMDVSSSSLPNRIAKYAMKQGSKEIMTAEDWFIVRSSRSMANTYVQQGLIARSVSGYVDTNKWIPTNGQYEYGTDSALFRGDSVTEHFLGVWVNGKNTPPVNTFSLNKNNVMSDNELHPNQKGSIMSVTTTFDTNMCHFKDSEFTKRFNREYGLTNKIIFNDIKYKLSEYESYDSDLFNKSFYLNWDDVKYLSDLKIIDFHKDNFKNYIAVLKSWKKYEDSNLRKAQGDSVDWTDVRMDRGMFSTTLIDTRTDDDIVGWITGKNAAGERPHVDVGDTGKIERKHLYSAKTGELIADLSYIQISGETAPHGPQFLYHEDGSLKMVSLMHKGKNVFFKVFFMSDKVVGYETYVNGEVTGYVTSYWDNGNVRTQTKYIPGLKTEAIASCNEDGSNATTK